MVVFEDGLPRKSEYRRFVIRQVEGQNDVAAMHEVITRRFRRLIDDRAAMTKQGWPADSGGDEGRCWSTRRPVRLASSRTRRHWWL